MGICGSKRSRVAADLDRSEREGCGSAAMRKKYTIDYGPRGTLGSGAYSTVYRCRLIPPKDGGRCHDDKEQYEDRAVKVIKMGQMAQDELDALKVEVEILRETSHPNILKLYDYFEDDLKQSKDDPKAYIVTELLQGGELFDRIVQRTYYSEFEARKVIQILLDVMMHLHEKFIVHRDLKPENLLLKSQKDDHSLKVADFGFAAYTGRSPHSATLSTQCGTPNYVAPEIIRNEKYGCEFDMWSIGVLTYVLLGGYPPFHNDNQKELFRRIKNADYQFDPQYWDVVSDDAKDFIKKLLVPSPGRRLTARQAMLHPWLVKGEHDLVLRSLEGALTNLKGFHARRKFKATAKMIITANRLSRLSASNQENLQVAKTVAARLSDDGIHDDSYDIHHKKQTKMSQPKPTTRRSSEHTTTTSTPSSPSSTMAPHSGSNLSRQTDDTSQLS